MNENYQLKYIKYKTKYLNLCKDILTNSKHKTENDYNNQIGSGDNINILFSCTTLNERSTLYKHFELINNKINEFINPKFINPLLEADDKKTALCVALDSSYIDENSPLVINMKANGYTLVPPIELSLMDYITTIEESINILVLSQCDDFVTVFMNKDFIIKNIISRLKNMTSDTIVDFRVEFEIFKDNLFRLYNSLNSFNGYIINIYYNDNIFTNIENSISLVSYLYILLHKMCCELFNTLFTFIEVGVYKKKEHITLDIYNRFYDEIYRINTSTFFGIINNKDTNEEKQQQIFDNFVPDKSISLGEKHIENLVKFYTRIYLK
jgi:hypothetical protein